MWARAAVGGPLADNVDRLADNVGLRRGGLAANLVPFWSCLWSHALLFVGHYTYVFLTTMAPIRPISPQTVTKITAAALHRANVESPIYGAHVLRHSAATHMLRQGASLSSIGAVLRHASVETTAHYAKVDLDLLQEVVKAWPEVSPC